MGIKANIGLWLVLTFCAVPNIHAQNTHPRFRHLTIDDGLSQNLIYSIFQDSKGFLWFGTSDGLNRYDGYRFKVFKHDPYDSTSLSDNELIYSIFEDHVGRLWVGTRSLNLFDRKTETFRRFVHDPNNPNSLSNGQIRAIAEDRDGSLWLGTSAGICRLTLTSVPDTTSVEGMDVFRVPAGDGYELVRVEFTSFVRTPGKPGSLYHNYVRSLIVDHRNRLWVAGGNWINMLDLELVKKGEVVFRYFPVNPKELYTDVAAVYEDRNGTIWISGGSGVSKVIEDVDQPVRFERFPFAFTDGNNWTNDIAEDAEGRLWIGTGTHLSVFDPKTGQHVPVRHDPRDPNGLSYNNVLAVHRDRSDNMWIGTSGKGIDIYVPRINQMRHYPGNPEVFQSASLSTRTLIETPDGLPNNVVYGILPDKQGNLWLSTNLGLSRITLRSDSLAVARDPTGLGIVAVKSFTVADGLQSNEFNYHSYHKGRSGRLYFGGINGITSFYPERIRPNRHIPPIVLTDLRLGYKSVKPRDPNSPIRQSIPETSEITLSYKENAISFELAALDFTAPQKNEYAFKLENLDDDWFYAGTERRANYVNLSAGKYVFRARGSNNDGVWNEQGISIRVTITPPWWQTWWAYTLYGVVLLGLLYSLRRYELNRVGLKNQLKIEQIEAERFRDLDAMKSRFFANISHEFRTPLTLILGPIDNLLEMVKSSQGKKNLRMMRRHSRHLLQLINQLLDLSKLESGKMSLQATCKDAIPVLRGVTSAFQSTAEKRNIDLQFHSEVANLELYLDHEKFEKIFYNLLSNAMKFTAEGGKVSVTVKVIRNPQSQVRDPKWQRFVSRTLASAFP